jgi:REP element-mobilizing transposase RayT
MKHFPTRKKIRLPLPVYHQGHAFFITIATYDKHPWFRVYPQLGDEAVQIVGNLASDLGIMIYAWCMMPDHVHFLMQGFEVIEFVRLFKGGMTPRARAVEPKRRLWQRSFFDHAVRKEESLSDIACYIWENPVRAGIVPNPTEYLWSGSEVWPNWRGFYGRG